jgi:hypothetical protein
VYKAAGGFANHHWYATLEHRPVLLDVKPIAAQDFTVLKVTIEEMGVGVQFEGRRDWCVGVCGSLELGWDQRRA